MLIPSFRSSEHGSTMRRAARAGVAGVLVALFAPGMAVAEGPGYGGDADALTVRWQAGGAEEQAGAASAGGALAIYAVGFRGGSVVTLRVGSAAEQLVTADAVGALRVLVVPGTPAPDVETAPGTSVLTVDRAAVDTLSPGATVQAVGRSPADGTRTLLGSVPPPPAGRGLQDLVPWAAALAALAAAAVVAARTRLAGRLRPRSPQPADTGAHP